MSSKVVHREVHTEDEVAKTEHAISMTDAWLKSITVETGRELWHDQKTKGLGLRVSFTGRKTWQVLYRVKGDATKRRMDLGTYPAVKLGEARELAAAALVAADRGDDPAKGHRVNRKALLFAELAHKYIDEYARPNKRSWEDDLALLERNVLTKWGRFKATAIKRADVIELLDEMHKRGARIPANRTLACVRKLYNWAISRDLVENNPCYQVKAPAKESPRHRVLTDDELRRVWKACDALSDHSGTMFRLRIVTGQRGGEVARMRWSDIDLEGGWWTIPAEFAKNGRMHRVPLPGLALELLHQVRELAEGKKRKSAWVFPARRGDGPLLAIGPATTLLRRESGVAFVPHDLRRTVSTKMAELGIDDRTIGRVLSHAEQGVTATVYVHYKYDREKREALDAWDKRLAALISTDS